MKEKKERLEEFLKIGNNSLSSKDFLIQKKKAMENVITSSEFEKDLNYHNALASKHRLLIMKILEQGELCNCALSQILGLSEGSITHHLKKLSKAGLIVAQKQGHFTIFYTKQKFLSKLHEE